MGYFKHLSSVQDNRHLDLLTGHTPPPLFLTLFPMVHLSPRPALGEVKRSKHYLAGCGACTQGVRAYHSASKGAMETKSA